VARLATWLFLSFLIFYCSITRGHFFTTDEVQVYEQTRSLWEYHDLSVSHHRNTIPGRGGREFVAYNAGQSILVLPLYGLGKGARILMERARADSWLRTFGGPTIRDPERHWGGDIEIYAVNLFNAFAVAALVTLFFVFNIRLGVAPVWAVASAAMLGLATHVAGFSVSFFQHPAEAFFLLLTFYLLFRDRHVWAGCSAMMMILIRPASVVLVPALLGYLIWKRRDRVAHFLAPVTAAVALTIIVNYIKWGHFTFSGGYPGMEIFKTPLLVGLYGFFFSPGGSVFLFSPLLLAAPWYFRPFARIYRKETVAILAISASYLLFYSKVNMWHGQWCFGPRYLMPLVPLLLLPLGGWLEHAAPRTRLGIVPLVLFGLWIELLHVAVNMSYVFYREGYWELIPPYAYVFLPDISQIAMHWRAILAWDDRVDMWALNISRLVSPERCRLVLLPMLAAMIFCARRVWRELKRFDKPQTTESMDQAYSLRAGL
jgi:hypothetical protein